MTTKGSQAENEPAYAVHDLQGQRGVHNVCDYGDIVSAQLPADGGRGSSQLLCNLSDTFSAFMRKH